MPSTGSRDFISSELALMVIKDEDDDCISISSTPPPIDDDVMETEIKMETSTFGDFGFCEELLNGIRAAKFLQPYETQAQLLTRAVQGRDILCQTPSKSGKTAVFVLSTLHFASLYQDQPKRNASPSVLVIAPTRELVEQIYREYDRFGSSLRAIRVVRVIGGLPVGGDYERFTVRGKSCMDIVVGTPGRLLDLVNANLLNLNNVKHFVVDEVHRSLAEVDMRADVQAVFVKTPHVGKQTMLFAAHLSAEARDICRNFLRDPFMVMNESFRRAKTLHQHQHRCLHLIENAKLGGLLELIPWLQNQFGKSTIQFVVFTDTIERTALLAKYLQNQPGFENVLELDSALNQNARLSYFTQFRANKSPILVATDLAARGLDIDGVGVVINFDRPRTVGDYIDRSRIIGKDVERSLIVTFGRDANDINFLRTTEELRSFNIRPFNWIL